CRPSRLRRGLVAAKVISDRLRWRTCPAPNPKLEARTASNVPGRNIRQPGALSTDTHPRYTRLMHVHAAPASASAGRTKTVLRFSLVATLAYVLVTLVAGLRAHSLALLSEAGHNASDFLALLLSFAAVYFQTRPATHAKTFGYQR